MEVIKKILRYARDDLLRVINAAASKLVQNLEKDTKLYLERREIDFYSYGQPNPKTLKAQRVRVSLHRQSAMECSNNFRVPA